MTKRKSINEYGKYGRKRGGGGGGGGGQGHLKFGLHEFNFKR